MRQKKRPANPDLRRVVEIALEEAKDLKKIQDELRAALEAGDDSRALQLARKLVGLPPVNEE